MKKVDGWYFPDREQHLIEWMTNPKNRMILNGRSAYQGKKIQKALSLCSSKARAIDVGAHIGLWTFNLMQEFRSVESFEPVADHAACLRENIDGVPCSERVTLYPYALGEKPGRVSMHTGPNSSGDTWVKGDGDIEMRTLDSFAFTSVDLIKIDCEGFEEFVLRGAEETVLGNKPIIVVEQKRDHAVKFGLKPQGAVQYLTTLGYQLDSEIGGDFFMVPKR